MKIFFASSEVVPFAKTGGLADVAGALPKALAKLGHEVKVVMPAYKTVKAEILDSFPLTFSLFGNNINCTIEQSLMPDSNVLIYFVKYDPYFGRDSLYQAQGQDYLDNPERFAFFSMAALALAEHLKWPPDIIHCNDWQSALIPTYLKTSFFKDHFFEHSATVYTVHNLAYQGLCSKDRMSNIGMTEEHFTPERLEFYGKLNIMKGGLVYADIINTVSPTYSHEMQTKEYGCGLEGLLLSRSQDIFGIINGLDSLVWDPNIDTALVANYSSSKLVNKKPNKEDLQKTLNLPVLPNTPLIGIVSRLDSQKGFDIIAEAIEDLLHLNIQIALLGTGDPVYHTLFEKLQKKHPEQVGISLKYDEMTAKKIYAGSDMFLMPSRYEPCGLGQLISLKYGTVPIVRQTGGLADTIIDYHHNKRSGNGFSFVDYTASALVEAVHRAVTTYREKTAWTKLMQRAMQADYSWEASAAEYVKLYKKAMSKVKGKVVA